MKNKIKLLISCSLGIALSFTLCQCKSPEPPKETAVATTRDTTAAMPDTTAVAPTPMPKAPTHTPLTLVIKNLASADAPIIVGLYSEANKFPDPKDQLKEYHFKPNGTEMVATIADLQFGVYAMAIYQDVNSNGKIDKNIIGIPTEPYAFSNNYKPTVKAPGFKNCKFEYDSVSNKITMNMIR